MLAKQYYNEFKPGGENTCRCGKPCHSDACAFCLDKQLRELGVSRKTMRLASAVFRQSKSDAKIKAAIKAIDGEVKK